jgi:hypothetical protein
MEDYSGRPWHPSTGTTGDRGPKGPKKQDKKTQVCLILKPTYPWTFQRPLHHCRLLCHQRSPLRLP